MTDKLFFWLDGALTHFCLAHYLQKIYDADYYAIIDTTNKPKKFFQEQPFVKFKKIWFYHDHINKIGKNPDLNYLSNFEKKYKINLWELAINERLFYRFNRFYKFTSYEILSILEQECKLFENILNEIKPTFFITAEPPLHHHELFYQICKTTGVKILMLNQPNINRCIISQELRKIDFVSNLENIEYNVMNFDELQKEFQLLTIYPSITRYRKKFLASKMGVLKAATDFLLSNNKNIKTHYTYYGRTKLRVFFDEIVILLKKKYRTFFIKKNLTTNLNYNTNFIYFPLSVDEERNILISAPFYTNQVETIRHIVKSLPIDYKLYVKENPAQVVRRWRKTSIYREIMEIPNVVLIHPDVSSDKLYKNSSLVITTAGSSGLEAAFYGKPSIIFAELGYAILPSVHKIKSFDELRQAIKSSLEKKVNANDLAKYLTLLKKNSSDFNLFDFETKYNDYFYFGGKSLSVDISISKMKNFLQENKLIMEALATEHVKKINELKQYKTN